jgi:geranylgeranyl pyrophosphate synthase
MIDTTFDSFKKKIREAVEKYLSGLLNNQPETDVSRVGRYAGLNGGHRWRAMAVVAAGQIFDSESLDKALPAACGVELAHAASLILDDLPSMDDAQVRRGKPCPHLIFPMWAVDMAPVFLVTLAYQTSLANIKASYRRRVKAALELSRAGLNMISGQVIDLTQPSDGDETERLMSCYRQKSGSLYATAAKAGAIICGADDKESELLFDCGMNLGMSYQLLDDVADVVAGVEEVGKDTGMDANKQTTIDIFGVEGTKDRANQYKETALSILNRYGPEADMLRALVCQASWAPT